MEDFNTTLRMINSKDLDPGLWLKILAALDKKEGVQIERKGNSEIQFSFPSYLYSKEHLVQLIVDAGFQEKIPVKRSLLRRFLDSIIFSNQTTLGSGRVNCCDLNK